MSFRQRQARGKAKVAYRRDRDKARQTGTSDAKWWLTFCTKDGVCGNPACRKILRGHPGSTTVEIVYCKQRGVLCVPCAINAGLTFSPSGPYRQAKKSGSPVSDGQLDYIRSLAAETDTDIAEMPTTFGAANALIKRLRAVRDELRTAAEAA